MEGKPGSLRGCNQWIHQRRPKFSRQRPTARPRNASARATKRRPSRASGPWSRCHQRNFFWKAAAQGFQWAGRGDRGWQSCSLPQEFVRATPLLISCTRGAGGVIGWHAVNGPPTRNPHVVPKLHVQKPVAPRSRLLLWGATGGRPTAQQDNHGQPSEVTDSPTLPRSPPEALRPGGPCFPNGKLRLCVRPDPAPSHRPAGGQDRPRARQCADPGSASLLADHRGPAPGSGCRASPARHCALLHARLVPSQQHRDALAWLLQDATIAAGAHGDRLATRRRGRPPCACHSSLSLSAPLPLQRRRCLGEPLPCHLRYERPLANARTSR